MTEHRTPYNAQATYSAGRLHLSSPPSHGGDQGGATSREYLVTIMQPGFVMQANGDPSTWLIPADVIERDAHLFDGVACYLDHPDANLFGMRGEHQVKNLVGIIDGAAWDPLTQALTGTLRLYDDDPSTEATDLGRTLETLAQGELPPMLADKLASDQGIHLVGQQFLSRGAILTGLIWGAMTALLIDGLHLRAAAFAASALVLSFVGFIHAPDLGWHYDVQAVWGYAMMAALFALAHWFRSDSSQKMADR